MFLGEEGMSAGANWILEIVLWPPARFTYHTMPSAQCGHFNLAKALRSIDAAWAVARQRAQTFPAEPLGYISLCYVCCLDIHLILLLRPFEACPPGGQYRQGVAQLPDR